MIINQERTNKKDGKKALTQADLIHEAENHVQRYSQALTIFLNSANPSIIKRHHQLPNHFKFRPNNTPKYQMRIPQTRQTRSGERKRERTWPPTTATEGRESQRVGNEASPPKSPNLVHAFCKAFTKPISPSIAAIDEIQRSFRVRRRRREKEARETEGLSRDLSSRGERKRICN